MDVITSELIHGAKGGGGGGHTPTEQPDDLLSTAKLRMLIALSEGEIKGGVDAQRIFINGTALADANGKYNFDGVKWEFRAGTQGQTYIPGMPEVDNEISVGQDVRADMPWTQDFTRLSLDAVRVKLSLPVQYQYKDNGDMVGTRTQYAIDLYVDGSLYNTTTGYFDGKTTSEYERDHRIDLPTASSSWRIRVRRVTPDSSSSKLVNAFSVKTYAEVIDSKLTYPNTALLFIELDAQQFNGSVPKVTCRPQGKLIRIPDNYNPTDRTYSGTWTGGWTMGYSNNPAWIFYDLVTDPIYGMGERVDASMIDKWQLYEIAKYCDEKVAIGNGKEGDAGKEPRFTCNAYIQNQQDAYTVLKDIAAIFRGITFWGDKQIYVNADVPQDDVDFVYHASNVVDGMFTYAGGSYKNRYTSCLVSWSDPQNHYSDTTEGVYDSDLVERYGVNQTQITAIGCTSQSEAHRRGRWVLLSNAKDATVSFSVGLDGYIPMPAEIIGIADPFRAGKQNGGRISAADGRKITLDREIDFAAGDRLVVNLPSGVAQTRTIESVSDDKRTVTVATAFNEAPAAGSVWAIDSDNLAIQHYRVTSIKASDSGAGGFTIGAVQHDPNKYRLIDDGVRIEDAPITVTPVDQLDAPQNVVISETSFVSQGVNVATMLVKWDKVDHAIRYSAQWRKDRGEWVNVAVTSAQGFSVQGIYSGSYDVRVMALNEVGTSSPWGYSATTALTGKAGKPGTPLSLLASTDVVWHIDLSWAFPAGSGDTAYTELQRSASPLNDDAELLSLVPYPQASYQHGPMPSGVTQYYRARLVDRIGNVGDWSEWVEGESSSDATEILNDITSEFMTTEEGKALFAEIDIDPEAILQNALASHGNVQQQWKQYGENKAGIVEVQQLVVGPDGIEGKVQDILTGLYGDGEHEGESIINQISEIRDSVEEAKASIEQDINSRLDKAEAAITTKMDTTVTPTSASSLLSWGAKVSYNGVEKDAGLVLGTTLNKDGSWTSSFGVRADQFVILNNSNSPQTPFAVSGDQVYISNAFIGNGTITTAKIADEIKSTDYVAGSKGWRMTKKGEAEFSGVTVRGTVNATSGTFSSGTFDNCTINANCKISGKLTVNQIEGDVVNVYTASKDTAGNIPAIAIPAKPWARNVIIMPLSSFGHSGQLTLRVYRNNAVWIEQHASAPAGSSNYPLFVTASGTYVLPAGQTATIRYQVEGGYLPPTVMVLTTK